MRSTTITIATLTCLGLAIPASAETRFFDNDGTPADWTGEGVWRVSCGGGVAGSPQPTDDAVICSGEDCTLDESKEVQTISVEDGVSGAGILRIPSGVTLTLNQDGGTSDIDGHLLLTGTLTLDWADEFLATHTFTGDGDIQGTAAGAKIRVAGGGFSNAPTLINNTTIHGILQIEHFGGADAILKLNAGTIHADANGTLKIVMAWMTDVPGTGNSLFKVSTHPGAIMDFDLECLTGIGCVATCLEYTEVEIFKGRFTFQQGFTTEETLTMKTGGRMVVPDGTSGSFDVDPSTCTQ